MATGKGEFFAVGKPQFQAACELGLNPAVALLVLARGTGRDNATTTWSAEAVKEHSGITWRRGNAAIKALEDAKIVEQVKAGARPQRKIVRPASDEDLIWLPNQLVSGAGDEIPPVARLRQGQDLDPLRLLIELYHDHELAGDGGIPRDMLMGQFERERFMAYGQFEVYGFRRKQPIARGARALARYWVKNPKTKLYEAQDPWKPIQTLVNLKLLQVVDYLAESDLADAELIHALSGDEYADAAAGQAMELMMSLPGGFSYQAERYDYALPIARHMEKGTVVGVFRLRYRPRTARTAAWFAQHIQACSQAERLYRQLAAGDFSAVKTGT